MPRMNWSRASNEYKYAQSYDYSARLDDAERASGRPDSDEGEVASIGVDPDPLAIGARPVRFGGARAQQGKQLKPREKKSATTPANTRKPRRTKKPKSAAKQSRSAADAIKEEARRTGRSVAEVLEAQSRSADTRPPPPKKARSTKSTSLVVSSGKARGPATRRGGSGNRTTPT